MNDQLVFFYRRLIKLFSETFHTRQLEKVCYEGDHLLTYISQRYSFSFGKEIKNLEFYLYFIKKKLNFNH